MVMEASGVHTEPVYYALMEQDFEQVAVINPAHAKALKGHKTDAKDALRLAELFECGLLRGSYIPSQELKDLRDLTRYRAKTVQARTSEIQRLAKALEVGGDQARFGGVRPDRQVGGALMIGGLIDGERRGKVLADLAIGRMRTAGKLADLSPGTHRPVHRSPRGAVPACTWTGSRCSARRSPAPGGEDRRQGHPLSAGAGPAEIDRRVR